MPCVLLYIYIYLYYYFNPFTITNSYFFNFELIVLVVQRVHFIKLLNRLTNQVIKIKYLCYLTIREFELSIYQRARKLTVDINFNYKMFLSIKMFMC